MKATAKNQLIITLDFNKGESTYLKIVSQMINAIDELIRAETKDKGNFDDFVYSNYLCISMLINDLAEDSKKIEKNIASYINFINSNTDEDFGTKLIFPEEEIFSKNP